MTAPNPTGRVLGIATRPRPGAGMIPAQTAEIEATGLAGEKRPGRKRQVSLLSREAWEAALTEAGADLAWTTRRANLLVEGLDLAETTGRRLRVGDAVLEITAETEPCDLMDRCHAGLQSALTPDWRGGASARVITPGRVSIGDPVHFEDRATAD